jgi:hypothetical protein
MQMSNLMMATSLFVVMCITKVDTSNLLLNLYMNYFLLHFYKMGFLNEV